MDSIGIGDRRWITTGSQRGTEIDKSSYARILYTVRDINPLFSTICSFQYMFSWKGNKKSTNITTKTFWPSVITDNRYCINLVGSSSCWFGYQTDMFPWSFGIQWWRDSTRGSKCTSVLLWKVWFRPLSQSVQWTWSMLLPKCHSTTNQVTKCPCRNHTFTILNDLSIRGNLVCWTGLCCSTGNDWNDEETSKHPHGYISSPPLSAKWGLTWG